MRASVGIAAAALLAACGGGSTTSPSVRYDAGGAHLEVADDDLIHFELSSTDTDPGEPIYTTPMASTSRR